METLNARGRWRYEEAVGAATPQVVVELMEKYGATFRLLEHPLLITTSRQVFARWLGRRVPSAYGGAYVYLTRSKSHAILINLERINHVRPKSLEIVIAEELMHMRDWIDGDRRRHARHGYDRIAYRVADITGSSLEDVREALVPVTPRPYRYLYTCPNCGHAVPRKRTGRWACRRCFERTGRHFVLLLTEETDATPTRTGNVQ